MSYINDALRKAQKERDNRYGKFGGIVIAGSSGTERLRRRRFFLFAAVLVILAAAALLPAVRALRNASPAGKVPPLAVLGVPAPPTIPSAVVQTDTKEMETSGVGKAKVPDGTARKAMPDGSISAAVHPSGGKHVAKESETRYAEAFLAQRQGDFPRAEALYQRVLSLEPGNVKALNNLGVIYMTLKKKEKAAEVLGRAVSLKKDYVDPYYNLACLFAQANELRESLGYLKIAAAIDGKVIDWVKKDADMKNVAASPEFKKIMEEQKN